MCMTNNDMLLISEMALKANEAGIRSTSQLSVFLKCAVSEGQCLFEIFSLDLDSPDYKSKYTAVRQLMEGAANRGYNGAGLLVWGENVYGKEKAIYLTAKGKRLFKAFTQKRSI